MLKIAGVKSEKDFYKKFPTEEAFMAKHGKAFKKAQLGNQIGTGGLPRIQTPTSQQLLAGTSPEIGRAHV